MSTFVRLQKIGGGGGVEKMLVTCIFAPFPQCFQNPFPSGSVKDYGLCGKGLIRNDMPYHNLL